MEINGCYVEYFYLNKIYFGRVQQFHPCDKGNNTRARFTINWIHPNSNIPISLNEKLNLNKLSKDKIVRIFKKKEMYVKDFLTEIKLLFNTKILRNNLKLIKNDNPKHPYYKSNTESFIVVKSDVGIHKLSVGDAIELNNISGNDIIFKNNLFGILVIKVQFKLQKQIIGVLIYFNNDGYVFIFIDKAL